MKATCASNYYSILYEQRFFELAFVFLPIKLPIDKIDMYAHIFLEFFTIALDMFLLRILCFFRTASVVDSYFLREKYHYRRRRQFARRDGKEEPKRMRKRKEDLENQVICASKQEFLVKLSIQFPCFLVRCSVFLSCRSCENLSSAKGILLIHSLNVLELICIGKTSCVWKEMH